MVSLPPVGGIADIVVVLREKSQLTRRRRDIEAAIVALRHPLRGLPGVNSS
jgi:hypothetical protein